MATRVSLFIPCLVDQVMPEVGLAMADLLEHLGYEPTYHREQTCCGQPAFNAGHRREARTVACHCLDVFADDPLIVSPSGSCTSMIRNHYPELFAGTDDEARAGELGSRVVEFAEFLSREGRLGELTGTWHGRLGVHISCHSYRELGQRQEPIDLLQGLNGCDLVVPEGDPVCCGFGGMFYVKHAPVAHAMGRSRLQTFLDLGCDSLAVNDPGCIMHMRQTAERCGMDIEILHSIDLLARAVLGDRQGDAS